MIDYSRQVRREGERVQFRVGQRILHRRYQYEGVICGWDDHCAASPDWIREMNVDRLPGVKGPQVIHGK